MIDRDKFLQSCLAEELQSDPEPAPFLIEHAGIAVLMGWALFGAIVAIGIWLR